MSDEMNLDLATAWRPPVGEVLVGKVVDVSRGWSDQAEKFYPIITIQPEGKVTVHDGDDKPKLTTDPVAVHGFHTVLYSRLVELKPSVDERIGIKYVKETTKQKGQARNEPAIYNVRVDGRAAAIWDTMEVDPRIAAAKAKAASVSTPDPLVAAVSSTEGDDDIPF